MRRVGVVVNVLAVATTAVGVAAMARGGSGGGTASATTIATDTATVERKTLVERDRVDGTLGYGSATSVTNRGQGTVTKLADKGATVERNGILYELDGKPVRLFYGTTPSYRRLAAGVDDGADVKQLEQNLKDLGLFKPPPDEEWDSATTAAVKRWQKSHKMDEDGVVEDGEIVFLPAAARVAEHKAEIGAAAQPGGPVLAVTGTTRLVDVDLNARKQRLAKPGAKVEVELPDGTTTQGTISKVGTVASTPAEKDDDPTIDVTVVLDDPAAGGSLDGAPVSVRMTSQSKEGVLAVPVNALLALAEGGYAVESAESHRLVRVETGLFSEGMVEVSGEGLTEGMKVVVPK